MNLPLPIRILLWPLSLIYGMGARCRVLLYKKGIFKRRRLKAPVISVGNLTVGGTGKTPLVIWLAKKFLAEGKSVAILTRGYGGRNGVSDEHRIMKNELGNRVKFGVGADRFKNGSILETEAPVDVFLLDDGYQHVQLARDLDVLLIDTSRPLREEMLLPAGRLREPKSAIARADVAVFTRTEHQLGVKRAIQEFPNMPIFPATTQLKEYRLLSPANQEVDALGPLPAQPVFAFCGIGNPDAFFSDLDRWGNVVADREIFRDHHKYTTSEISQLEQRAIRAGARSIIMTAKDAENLGRHNFVRIPAYVCEIEFKVGDEAEFLKAVKVGLSRGKG
ncbi:MAG TPA: tetraacyldisaccharide 4'-kinase [Candidatus Acidoferrum sp.]|nr:tetraacyldisaccharide 4'-kinase [Candidatus Acidoferrum sp.]